MEHVEKALLREQYVIGNFAKYLCFYLEGYELYSFPDIVWV